MKPTNARIRPGAVVEIQTNRGLAYAQYTHWNALMGSLIRILPGLYDSRPSDISALVRKRDVHVAFYPLEAAVREGTVEIVGHEDVPPDARSFPRFRVPGPREPGTGKVLSWWLWDGEREWKPEKFRPEDHQLPVREVVMPPLLVTRLEEGWSSDDGSGNANDAKQPPDASRSNADDSPMHSRPEPSIRHFLYFSSEDWARKAANIVRTAGYVAELRPSSDAHWLLLVSSLDRSHPEAVRTHLEQLTAGLKAEYDGWEAALGDPDP